MMTRQIQTLVAATAGLIVCMSNMAAAAPITWQAATNSTSAPDVRTDGTLIQAINGSPNAGNVTVNGVTFTNSNAVLDQTAINGVLNGNLTGDANFDTLLNSLDYGNGMSTSITLAAGMLTPGRDYLVQVFYTDLRSPTGNGRVMTYGDGEISENLVQVASGGPFSPGIFGQFAVGTFTADSTGQTLTMLTSGFGNAHFNAFQVRELAAVPEPAGYTLWGITALVVGAVCLRKYRRRVSN